MISEFDTASSLDPSPERVLVIPRAVFDQLEPFQGFRLLAGREDLGVYLQSAPFKRALFMNKPEAELDPSFKQLLPYIVVMTGENVLTYRRGPSGDEGRLHGLLSIGVGGHINDTDHHEPYQAFIKGTLRELHEEIGLQADETFLGNSVLGLVNDDSNAVGEVHLGVVSVIQVGEGQAAGVLKNCERTMLNPVWVPIDELMDPRMIAEMETWSQIVVAHLKAERDQGGKWEQADFKERVLLTASCAANVASCCAGLMLQENPRTHQLCVGQLERAVGQLQCMISGLTSNFDIDGELVKEAAMGFHQQLGSILKHQKINDIAD